MTRRPERTARSIGFSVCLDVGPAEPEPEERREEGEEERRGQREHGGSASAGELAAGEDERRHDHRASEPEDGPERYSPEERRIHPGKPRRRRPTGSPRAIAPSRTPSGSSSPRPTRRRTAAPAAQRPARRTARRIAEAALTKPGDGSTAVRGAAAARRFPPDASPLHNRGVDEAPRGPGRSEKSVAVVGGGLAGLVAADRLLAAGLSVTVFEKYPEAGGLVGTFSVGGESLERFYHHLFTSDVDYVSLAGELGLGGEIEWLPSKMGFFSGGRLYAFGTPASLLGFSPLGVKGRARARPLDAPPPRDPRLARPRGGDGRRLAQEERLRPRPRRRLGSAPDAEVRPARRGGRASSGSGGRSPCAPARATGPASANGSATCAAPSGASSRRSPPASRPAGGELRTARPVRIASRQRRTVARRVPRRLGVVRPRPLDGRDPRAPPDRPGPPSGDAHALGRRSPTPTPSAPSSSSTGPLTPFYWTNVGDVTMPFGGFIEHTNYIPPSRYGGHHVVYLSDYVLPDDPKWTMPDRELWDVYLPAVSRLAPAVRRRAGPRAPPLPRGVRPADRRHELLACPPARQDRRPGPLLGGDGAGLPGGPGAELRGEDRPRGGGGAPGGPPVGAPRRGTRVYHPPVEQPFRRHAPRDRAFARRRESHRFPPPRRDTRPHGMGEVLGRGEPGLPPGIVARRSGRGPGRPGADPPRPGPREELRRLRPERRRRRRPDGAARPDPRARPRRAHRHVRRGHVPRPPPRVPPAARALPPGRPRHALRLGGGRPRRRRPRKEPPRRRDDRAARRGADAPHRLGRDPSLLALRERRGLRRHDRRHGADRGHPLRAPRA